jgi:diacylglycerol O-acyltransferase / wax synthase
LAATHGGGCGSGLGNAMGSYERLSGLDECFLGFETPNAHMHVAVTGVFEGGPLGRAGGGIDVDRIRAHLAERLPLVPRFRQRLQHLPVVRDAVWIDDDCFDLGHHVRHASLPQPGSREQLQQRCAEILEGPLDRRRPLWEAWIVEGLAGGGFALIVKVHHCIVDGVAGIGMLASVLDGDPAPGRPRVSSAGQPRPAPTSRELLRDEVVRRMRAAIDVGRAVGRIVFDPVGGAARVGLAAGSLWRLVRTGLSPAPEVCFNRPIGPRREVAWQHFDLASVKAIAHRLGGTVNDVVLTVVSGAVGAALRVRGETVPGEPLRAVVPVSVRAAEELGAPGNRVSFWLVPLPVHDRDPRRRFHRIHETTAELKRGGQATGGAVFAEAANWAGGVVVEAAARLIASARIYNLILSNVPGPSAPLYLAGARMREVYPHLPLFERQGISVALLSYVGRLAICVTADSDLGGLQRDIVQRFEAGLAELGVAVGVAAENQPGRPRPRPATDASYAAGAR